MTQTEKPGFLSFMTMPTPPSPDGGYQTGATMLKVIGWIRFVTLILTALIGLLGLLMAVLFEAALIAALERTAGSSLPAALGGLLIVVILIGLIVALAVGAALLYWNSWCYAKWANQEAGSAGAIKTYAIVSIVLSGLGSLGILSGDITALTSVAILVCAIILVIKLGEPEVDQVLGQGPVPELQSLG